MRTKIYLLCAILLLAACSEVEDPNKFTDCQPGVDGVCYEDLEKKDPITIVTAKGPVVFHSEIQDTPVSRSLGMMHRDALPDNEGMFFVFQLNSTTPFWMKSVKVPLDMIFISYDGIILYMKENAPPCKADPCPTYGPGTRYTYVLEINGGLAKKHGIAVGDQVQWEKDYVTIKGDSIW